MNKENVRTGCISWTYPDWKANFYPEGAKSADYLSLYSRVFDIVEVDSSFYRTPSPSLVAQWKAKTPENFLFTAKMPGRVTHQLKLKSAEREIQNFESNLSGLGGKIACIFVQLPPALKYDKHLETFKSFLTALNPKLRYAIEFRDPSWVRQDVFDLLKNQNVCMVWSVSEHIESFPAVVTSDFVYLRFIGNFKEITKFDRIQVDKKAELDAWWNKLSRELENLKSAYALCSNHFAGFAPSTVNEFRGMAGLEKVNWSSLMSGQDAPSTLLFQSGFES